MQCHRVAPWRQLDKLARTVLGRDMRMPISSSSLSGPILTTTSPCVRSNETCAAKAKRRKKQRRHWQNRDLRVTHRVEAKSNLLPLLQQQGHHRPSTEGSGRRKCKRDASVPSISSLRRERYAGRS